MTAHRTASRLLGASLALLLLQSVSAHACAPAGQWLDANGKPVSASDALARARSARIILLGEEHATLAHHQWQADVIRSLAADGRPLVVGLEQLTRSEQPALDALSSGQITPEAFRTQSKWDTVWKHDFNNYLPVINVISELRIPSQALNIDRTFVRSVGKVGYTEAARNGAPAGRPAAPDPAYRASLEEVFRAHAREASPEAVSRFIEAQTIWDRAMAEGIASALVARPEARVAAIMGHGHVSNGYGVAHQLKAMGYTNILTAIPVRETAPCPVEPGAADLLFGAGDPPAKQ